MINFFLTALLFNRNVMPPNQRVPSVTAEDGLKTVSTSLGRTGRRYKYWRILSAVWWLRFKNYKTPLPRIRNLHPYDPFQMLVLIHLIIHEATN